MRNEIIEMVKIELNNYFFEQGITTQEDYDILIDVLSKINPTENELYAAANGDIADSIYADIKSRQTS